MDRFGEAEIFLTERERDIVSLVADGGTAKAIARTMNLSPRTVERHIENSRLKLGASNKAQLVAKAITDGLVVG